MPSRRWLNDTLITMRFLLATYGSRGDTHPMIALARELVCAGHAVIFAGPPDFTADVVREPGVEFHPMGSSIEKFMVDNRAVVGHNVFALARLMKQAMGPQLAAQFEVLSRLVKRVDHVVGASLAFATPSCAEWAGRPYHAIAFAPEVFPSRHYPALGEPRQNMPRIFNRCSWWVARRLDNWLLRKALNLGRAELGLPPISDVVDHYFDPRKTLLAADVELASLAPDVPAVCAVTGAMLLPNAGELSDEILRFLDAGDPPIYLGFGSMPDAHTGRTTQLLASALREVNCRAVLSRGLAGLVIEGGDEKWLCVEGTPHEKLFPRMAAVIHHGGAGTCARAARAGVPQVIVPHLLDQFPAARRMATCGIAPRPIPRHKLTAQSLAEAIHMALTQREMREKAATLGRSLQGKNGAKTAAAWLSEHG